MKLLRKFPYSCDIRKILFLSLLIVLTVWVLLKLSISMLGDLLVIDKPLPHAEALVVMAGSVHERLPAAVRLYQRGIAPKILLTNDGVLGAWSEEKHRNLYLVEWAESELMKMQIPEKAIVKLAYSSSGSIYDALNSRKEILGKGIKSIIIVTSDYHTRRSLWSFEKVLQGHAVAVGVYPAVSEISKASDFTKFPVLCREMISYIYYRLKYRDIE